MTAFDEISKHEWVTQAAEGVQFLVTVPAFAAVDHSWKESGIGYNRIFVYVKDEYLKWVYWTKDLERVSRAILKKEKEKPGFVSGLMEEWREHEKVFVAACAKLDQTDFQALTDDQLVELFQEWIEKHLYEWAAPMLADAWSMYSENILNEALEKDENDLKKHLPLLTSPVDQSFAMEEKIDLLKLAQGADERVRNAILRKDLAALKGTDFFDALSNHVKKYFWIRNSYLHVRILDEEFFTHRLCEELEKKYDIEKEIERLSDAPKKTEKEKKKLIQQLHLGEEIVRILDLIESMAAWQDLRKKYNLIGNHYMGRFLEEAVRRTKIKRKTLAAMTPREFKGVIKGEISMKDLEKRENESLIAFRHGEKEEILSQDMLEKVVAVIEEDNLENVTDIRGTCVSPGKAEGIVKLILCSEDVSKMNKGDILVSSMTRPEVVSAMEKAAAIVTDEGGMTSHAAIVSRELGIPCVVGTKIATKLFKDGEYVQVNADHGVVKKLK